MMKTGRGLEGELALEYAGRFIILFVSIAVIASVIWQLYNQSNPPPPPPPPAEQFDTELVKKDSFSSKEIADYIEGCWSFIAADMGEEFVCYNLIGEMDADYDSIMGYLPADIRDKADIRADFSSGVVSISLEKGSRVAVA